MQLIEKKSRVAGGAEKKPFRCFCGSLLARLVPGGVELKCRKCKRQIIVPLTETEMEEVETA